MHTAGCPDSPEDIISSLSHDLRGPLLNLRGFLRRLRRACESLQSEAETWNLTPQQRQGFHQVMKEKVWESLDILERNAQRLEGLTVGMLALSKAASRPLDRKRFPAAQAAYAVGEEFRTVAEASRATVEIGPLPEFCADPGRVEEIFRQLLRNALQFLSPDRPGRIRIGGRVDGGEAICWVQDNGIGVRPQDQARIFQPFGQACEIRTSGCGVGLATARRLAEQQGGRIWVESTHGQGSTFFVALPLDPPPHSNLHEESP